MRTFSKRLLTFVLAAAMVFGLSGMTAFAAEPEETAAQDAPAEEGAPAAVSQDVSTEADGTAALSDTDGGIRMYAELPASGDLASGTYQLTSDFTTTDTLTVPADMEVILDLNGHVLTIAADINHFGIEVNGTLTIEDTSADADGYITRGEAYRGVIHVADGMLNLLSGGIRDCSNTVAGNYGGIIFLMGGRFEMTGGTISGNECPHDNAGAIRVWTGSTFTMTGGTITGNMAGGDGAAIYATSSGPGDDPAVVNISGGTITGNTSGGSGGGIYSNYAIVTFSGDSLLYGNTADVAGSDLYKAGPDNYTTTIRDQFGTEMVMDNRILNGWYRDNADDRWNYVRASDETNYTERYEETTITEQDVALIAAFDATAERPGPFPNKLDLEDEYNEDILLNEDEYTAESWALFAAALDNARDMIERDDVTQEEVNAAEEALLDTKAALKVKPVNYAVRIWGIGTDTYSYDDGVTTKDAGLTFGPATGESYVESYKAHLTKEENDADNGKYCIHWMTWEEIIALSQTNPKRLQDCLQYGCTKTVELAPNETLFNMTAAKNAAAQRYDGDGVSTLSYLLNGAGGTGNYTYGAVWNVNYDNVSEKDPANIYSRSRMRATLTGDSADARAQVEAGGNDYYGLDTICDETDCLLSCFPQELQGAVVPRTTLNTGNGDNSTSTAVNDKTTYDKLFLFSLREYGIEQKSGLDDSGGDDYGIFSTDSERVAYEFGSAAATGASAQNAFTRSRYFATPNDGRNYATTHYVNKSGTDATSRCSVSQGLSPGFCLPGPEEWPEYLTILLDDEEREIFYEDIDDVLADTPEGTLTDANGNKVTARFVSLRDLIGFEGDFCTYTVTTSDGTETVGLPADTYLYWDADAEAFRTAVDGGDASLWINAPSVIEVVRTHDWNVTWDWSEDYSSATADGTCALCGREETVDAVISSETLEPTAREDGETVYTAEATFSDGTVVTDERTKVLPAEGEPEVYDVKYAVTIWGILQDVDDEGNLLGLTFGPATGADYRKTYVAHMTKGECDPENGSYCIHWMTWDEIVEQSREDPTVFQDCLEYGCTHSVMINYNETLAGTERYEGDMDRGDGASTIYTSIDENYATWNGGSDDGTGGWPASQLRAVLNGKDDLTGDNAPYAPDEEDSLYSCLPEELQAGIVPKAVKTDTVATDKDENNVTTYDKLWLFSVSESFATSYTAYSRPNEGGVYQRPERLTGASSDVNANLIAYDEDGSTDEIWRLRSFGESNTNGVGINSGTGGRITQTPYADLDSLSFGFCLEGPDGPTVKYAVQIWGIGEDTYSEDGGETTQTAGLTFGPATGESYLSSYKSCGSDYCIHDMTWEEIIEQSEEDPLVFESCLENGCTKAVELTTNGKLFNRETVNNVVARNYSGDGVGTLFYLLNGTGSPDGYGANWNASYSGRSDADPANIYSRSRIRTTLTGNADNIEKWLEENPTVNDYYGVSSLCNEYNCLLSCFPQELREAVVPRTTENAGSPASGTSAEDETTYDKLFLFSLGEIGLTDYGYDDGGGLNYGVNTDCRVYEFSDTDAVESVSHVWHSRSRSAQNNYYTCRVTVQGAASAGASSAAQGLSPGFCLPGPEDWPDPSSMEPTVGGVKITSTLNGSTKTYDGAGLSLTASATTRPRDVQVTYQWYKKNAEGEYEAINGAEYNLLNIDGNVSDSGTYKCVVTAVNSVGEASGEAEFTLSITAAEQDISFAASSVTKTVDDGTYTNELIKTTVSGEDGAGITYTSSNPSVGTVDADGMVTILAVGETTITATAAETANYKAASASYVLTITEDEEPGATADKEELEKELTETEEWISGRDGDDYTADSWAALEKALANAQTVVNDQSATQDVVDQAYTELKEAKANLVSVVDLRTEYDADSKLSESDYTAESWKLFAEALASAKTVLNDENATQTEIDNALASLKNAKDALEKKASDSGNGGNGGNGGNDKNGLYMIESGKLWGYYVDGKVDTDYTGFAKNENGKWYVVDGYIRFDQNTVAKDAAGAIGTKDTWYYVIGNKVQESFTGLADYSNANGWWYIKNGVVDFTHNGVDKNKNGWWYVTGGKVQFGFTGLANYKNANGWWYITNGKVNFNANTVAKNKNGWWYVTSGKVQFGFTGLANYKNANGWWYIKAGKVDFTHNGVDKNKNGWWYVRAGKVNFNFNGRASNQYGTWNIVNGKVVF